MMEELEKGVSRGPEVDKGAIGGLFINHYDLMAIGIVVHITHYQTKPTKVA